MILFFFFSFVEKFKLICRVIVFEFRNDVKQLNYDENTEHEHLRKIVVQKNILLFFFFFRFVFGVMNICLLIVMRNR